MTRPDGDFRSIVRKVHVPGLEGPVRIHVILGFDDGDAVREVFVYNAPNGTRGTTNALCRLLSHVLQAENDVSRLEVARMLRSQYDGHAPVPWTGGGFVVSLPDALARLLEEIGPRGERESQAKSAPVPGRLEVILGCMFSGKTEEALRRLRRAEIAKQTVCLVRPIHDTRTPDVQAHSGATRAADILASADFLSLHGDALPQDLMLMVIDEGQFFESDAIVGFCRRWVRLGARVVVAGLDLDWRGEPFTGMACLAAEADEVVKLAAVCVRCGAAATRSRKIVAGLDRIDVGGADKYEASCLACFLLEAAR